MKNKMRNNWRYRRFIGDIKAGILTTVICSLVLLTGCGGSETATVPQNNTQEYMQESESRNASVEEQLETETQKTEEVAESITAKMDYAMVVRITINPKVALYLAHDGSVVDVEYLNEDAENAFSDLNITGTKFEDAVSMIVDVSAQEGYLTEGKTISVDFVESNAEETAVAELTETVQAAIQDTLTERQLTATLEIEVAGIVQESVALEPETATGQDVDGQQTEEQQTEEQQTAEQNSENSETTTQPCSACGGTGVCPECGGGTLPCKRCGGTLWESCGVCGGDGQQTCQGCRGAGTDATSGGTCRHCSGAGTYTCEVCGGSGGKSCSICNGKGVVSDDCILCHGGKACTTCGGTGTK